MQSKYISLVCTCFASYKVGQSQLAISQFHIALLIINNHKIHMILYYYGYDKDPNYQYVALIQFTAGNDNFYITALVKPIFKVYNNPCS